MARFGALGVGRVRMSRAVPPRKAPRYKRYGIMAVVLTFHHPLAIFTVTLLPQPKLVLARASSLFP